MGCQCPVEVRRNVTGRQPSRDGEAASSASRDRDGGFDQSTSLAYRTPSIWRTPAHSGAHCRSGGATPHPSIISSAIISRHLTTKASKPVDSTLTTDM